MNLTGRCLWSTMGPGLHFYDGHFGSCFHVFCKKNMVGCRVLYQKENIPEVGVKAEVFCRHPEMLSNGC